jgi:hypothetical protein
MLSTTEREAAISPVPPARPRLVLQPDHAGPAPLDGGWWPRSADPAAELPGLVLALDRLHGRVTQRRKRSVFYNALGYAVEQGHLAANPVDRIQWTTPAVAQSVDRRVVVSPAPGTCWPPSADSAAGERTWKRSTPACTTPPCAPRRRSCSARVTCTCRRRDGGGSSWPPPPPAPDGLDRPRHRPPGTRPEDLRALHRRAGGCRQQAHHRRSRHSGR